jgi:hypothetical protein
MAQTLTKDEIKKMFTMKCTRDEIATALKNYFASLPKISPIKAETFTDPNIEFAEKLFDDRGPAIA